MCKVLNCCIFGHFSLAAIWFSDEQTYCFSSNSPRWPCHSIWWHWPTRSRNLMACVKWVDLGQKKYSGSEWIYQYRVMFLSSVWTQLPLLKLEILHWHVHIYNCHFNTCIVLVLTWHKNTLCGCSLAVTSIGSGRLMVVCGFMSRSTRRLNRQWFWFKTVWVSCAQFLPLIYKGFYFIFNSNEHVLFQMLM